MVALGPLENIIKKPNWLFRMARIDHWMLSESNGKRTTRECDNCAYDCYRGLKVDGETPAWPVSANHCPGREGSAIG